MAAKVAPGFGINLQKIEFKNQWDWLVKLNDCEDLWKAQPSYLLSQEVLVAGAVLTLIHSLVKRGRWPYLWFSGLILGISLELINYFTAELNNVWHSQSPVIFFGGRLPLHVACFYAVLVYQSAYAVSRLRLPGWSEPFATSLLVVLMSMPYDIIGVKFMHMVWHDTDPNIADRHYWTPFILYIVRAVSTATLMFFFQMVTKMFKVKTEKWMAVSFPKEMLFSMMSCMMCVPVSLGIVIVSYAFLHDGLLINTEVIFILMMVVFIVMAWLGDRSAITNTVPRMTKIDWILILHLLAHFMFYFGLVLFGKPETEYSIGLHEPVVPCDQITRFKNVLGNTLVKRNGLCLTGYNEDYHFRCLSADMLPKNGSVWYTICGSNFRNRNEYIAIMSGICFLAFMCFYNLYFKGSPEPQQSYSRKKNKMN